MIQKLFSQLQIIIIHELLISAFCPYIIIRYFITIIIGWERTGQMLCMVDTSLSVLMTLRMCLRELCVFLLFGFKPLGKGVLPVYVFIMAIFGDG